MELINFDNPKSALDFLLKSPEKIAAFITGILISDSNDWKLSAGRIVQASIKCKLFSQLGKEIMDYIKKGKIEEDFLDNDQNKQSFSDLLKFIDEVSPSEDRFNAMKKLFLKSVSNDSTHEEQILSYQFMKICNQLESSHLLVLKAAFDITCNRFYNRMSSGKIAPNDTSAEGWLKNISDQIGHGISSLVEVQEDKLINLKLIGPRTHVDKSGVHSLKNYRLTDLGYKICDFIYEN